LVMIGKEFPLEIKKDNPVAWARATAARIIKKSAKDDRVLSSLLPQLVTQLDEFVDEEILRQPVVHTAVPGGATNGECNVNSQGQAEKARGRIERREAIDVFMSKVAESGRKIRRKDIWIVAGYKDRTEFERFQRGSVRTTRSAIDIFNRVLAMEPENFIRTLDRRKTPK
jgi:hypothetical protein